MIPGAMRFHEYYSVPNQLQVLDAVGYEGAEGEFSTVCRVMAVVNEVDPLLTASCSSIEPQDITDS
jgi:hypothetical protein